MQILNLELMKNPFNWFIVLFILLISAIGGHLLLSYLKLEPAK